MPEENITTAEPVWFYTRNKRDKIGPVSWRQLQELAITGELQHRLLCIMAIALWLPAFLAGPWPSDQPPAQEPARPSPEVMKQRPVVFSCASFCQSLALRRTSPYYPQSNGKIERRHKTLKADCIRPGIPLSLEDARRLVAKYVEHYNTVRLHSAIGYVTPKDKLAGREKAIFAERDRQLGEARERRKIQRQQMRRAAG